MAAAARKTEKILTITKALSDLTDLRPRAEVNALFSALVAAAIEIHDTTTLQQILSSVPIQRVLPRLHSLCSEAEFLLETQWAQYIIDSKRPQDTLKVFPYYHNYRDLVKMELAATFPIIGRNPDKIAFIGSGPLPLTSISILQIMNHHPKRECLPIMLNIDRDSEAIAQSIKVCHKLGGYCSNMRFHCNRHLESLPDLSEQDLVYMAALVGDTQAEKELMLVATARRMRRGALLIVRSAWGLRTLLYPEVDLATSRAREVVDICTVVHPYNDVVNSIIVAKVK